MQNGQRDHMLALIKRFAGQANVLTIPRFFIDLCDGDHLTALLLSQIVYWSDRKSEEGGWFAKSYEDWYEELAMSQYQTNRASKKLKDEGLIETKLKRSPYHEYAPTVHYRVMWNALSKCIVEKLHNPDYEETSQSENEETQQSYTETTSEITPETNAESSTDVERFRTSLSGRHVRVPRQGVTLTDREASEKKGKKSPTDPDFPEVGRLVLAILSRNKKDVRNLTEKQVEDLKQPVIVPEKPDVFPSPEEEFRTHRKAFELFVEQFEQMPFWKHNPITAGNVIKAMRGYHYAGGWFQFRPRFANEDYASETEDDDMPDWMKELNKRK